MKLYCPSRIASLLVVLATLSLEANTFTVIQTNSAGAGSLPVIIEQANAAPGDQTIEFGVTGTITLVSPLPTITNNLSIDGRAGNPVIISGGGTTPIFTFAMGTTNTLSQLVLMNGYTAGDGAAINNAGTLFVSDCALSNNIAPSGNGGAIKNGGVLTIETTTIAGIQLEVGKLQSIFYYKGGGDAHP